MDKLNFAENRISNTMVNGAIIFLKTFDHHMRIAMTTYFYFKHHNIYLPIFIGC